MLIEDALFTRFKNKNINPKLIMKIVNTKFLDNPNLFFRSCIVIALERMSIKYLFIPAS